MSLKLMKKRTVKDEIFDFTEWRAMKDDIVYATIYQGCMSWYRTRSMRDWHYVVKYVSGDEWAYEHFKKFKDARARALEITEIKSKS